VARKSLPNGLVEITAAISNNKPIPTRLAVDVQNKISRPDWITISGVKVISGGIKYMAYEPSFAEQKYNPEKLSVQAISGNSIIYAVWIVDGSAPVTISVDSQKGGKAVKQLK